jgi:hypothetical protein
VFHQKRSKPYLIHSRLGHDIELDAAFAIFAFEEIAAPFHIHMVPWKHLGNWPFPLGIKRRVDSQFGSRFVPDLGAEMFPPSIKPGSLAPGKFQKRGGAPIATREDSFEEARLDVMVLDPNSDFFKAMRGSGAGNASSAKK